MRSKQVEASLAPCPAEIVAKMTGPHSATDTESARDIGGTDIGVFWDNGETWRLDGPAWNSIAQNNYPFQISALARQSDWTFLFGTPNRRFENVSVAPVSPGTILDKGAAFTQPNLLRDQSFVRQGSRVDEPWTCEGDCGIDADVGADLQFSGRSSLSSRGNADYAAAYQSATVRPHTSDSLAGFIRASVTGERPSCRSVGVRKASHGTVIAEATLGGLPNYIRREVTFDSGDRTTLEIFIDTTAGPEPRVSSPRTGSASTVLVALTAFLILPSTAFMVRRRVGSTRTKGIK